MLIISDTSTLFFTKEAKKKGLEIKKIIDFTTQTDRLNIHKESEVIILLSESFYKLLPKDDFNLLSFEEMISDNINILNNILGKIINNDAICYLSLIPNHFLYSHKSDLFMNSTSSYASYINKINQIIIENYIDIQNINIIQGLKNIGEDCYKDYFRFQSFYNIKNSNIIIDQIILAREKRPRKTKKLIILDLDNTLWKGILSEDQMEGLRMDPSDPIGFIYYHVQSIYLRLKNNGYLLALCSKNDEEKALEALFKSPSSQFRERDIVSHRINWRAKSFNINEICNELNLSPKEAIFIDDNEHECDEVKTNCNGISIIKVPENIYTYPSLLINHSLLAMLPGTKEDKERTQLYKSRVKRIRILKKTIEQNNTKDDWIKSLNICLDYKYIDQNNLFIDRVVQLFNRTNQFNTSGNRFTVNSFKESIKGKNVKYYYGKASDRLGSEGIISVVGIKILKNEIEILDYILSCRVFGRYLEEVMLLPVLEIAISMKKSIRFNYINTTRNKSAKEFIMKLTTADYYIKQENIKDLYNDILKLPIKKKGDYKLSIN